MNFLIDQIKEQAILEMEVNIDNFLEENNISESAVIYELNFDSEVFADEKEVREYLKDKCFYNPVIQNGDNGIIARVVSASQIDAHTTVEIELRRGVTAKAGDLLPVQSYDEINFNAKGQTTFGSSKLFGDGETINLHEGLPYIIEIARVAEGEHPSYGKLKITQEH